MIKLKKISLKYAKNILEMHQEKDFQKYYLKKLIYNDINKAKKEINNFKKLSKKGLAYFFVILYNNEFAGTLDIWKTNKKNYRTCVGYGISKKYWGKGIAKNALKQALEFIKNEMKMHAVEATAHPKNIASQKVLLANGFAKIGLMKDYHFDDGKFVDRLLFWKIL